MGGQGCWWKVRGIAVGESGGIVAFCTGCGGKHGRVNRVNRVLPCFDRVPEDFVYDTFLTNGIWYWRSKIFHQKPPKVLPEDCSWVSKTVLGFGILG